MGAWSCYPVCQLVINQRVVNVQPYEKEQKICCTVTYTVVIEATISSDWDMTYSASTDAYTYTHIEHTCVFIYVYTLTHTHNHTRTHAHIHSYICTCICRSWTAGTDSYLMLCCTSIQSCTKLAERNIIKIEIQDNARWCWHSPGPSISDNAPTGVVKSR